MSQASLFPGYSQVEAFGDDDEYIRDENGDIVEEVEYVTLDIGNVQPELLNSSETYRLIGLDTPTPYLQLSGTIFRGEHHNLLGTELLFAEDKDEADPTKKHAAHLANSERRIRFREVELLDKNRKKPVSKKELDADDDGDDGPVSKRGGRGRGRGRGRGGKSRGAAKDVAGQDPPPTTESPSKAGPSGTQDVSMDLT
ncbi:unnamed protein product [Peniophora sp. CBMAI 1063]|nr:unnamed protein product [Peniophora sp. CBMAI 1063]